MLDNIGLNKLAFLIRQSANIDVKITRLNKDAIIPKYQHPSDSGVDLHSTEEVLMTPGEIAKVSTGLAIQLPQNVEAQVRPRSGLSWRQGLTVLNTPGTIDQGYTGEIQVMLINHGNEWFKVTKGMRIAQLVFAPVLKANFIETNEFAKTDRQAKGFGSTGI